MKKTAILLLLITSLLSCSIGERETYSYYLLPVESYTVPESFMLGETYEITLKYQKPNSCHLFREIYYSSQLNTRTIGVQTAVRDNEVCTQELPPLSEVSFNFIVNHNGSYIFKFYKGKDVNGSDLFEEVEIPVVE